MRGLLIDTNVVSELRKPVGRINSDVQTWATTIDSSTA
jgi:hypothetical protein